MSTPEGGELSRLRERVAELEQECARLRSSNPPAADAETYWDMVRSAPIPMFVTVEGRIALANDAAVSGLGASTEQDLTGRPVFDLVHPDFHAVVSERINATVSSGTRSATFEEQLVRLDGAIIEVEVTAWPISYGGRTALQVMFTDIGARKKAESALRDSERIYRAIGETLNYGVWVCEPDGRNIYASESFLRLVGITQEQCSEFGWGNVLHPDDSDRTIARWKECARTGSFWDIEHRYLGVDGKYHPILARGIPVKDDEGRIVCWAGINLDISRLKRAEEELARSNADLERFADVVAHDLQAPLRSIAAFSQLLVQRFSAEFGSEERELAGHIQSGIQGMEHLIRGLLAYSRATRPHGVRTTVDAGRIANSVKLMFRDDIAAAGAEVLIDPLPSVLFDAAHLSQIFQNLLANALKYRGLDPPRVRISAAASDQEWTFSVADNGPGIRPCDRDRVFDMFQRLSTDSSVPGAGIGLAICKRLITANRGRIWVEPAGESGAKFCFIIPRNNL